MHFGQRVWQGITMYRLMLYFMITLVSVAVILSTLTILPYDPWAILLQIVLCMVSCWLVNRVVAWGLGISANIESSLITGLILAAIAGPLMLPRDWLVLMVMAGSAMVSKYLFVSARSHIFNPAAFGVVVSALLLGQPASWWIGSPMLLPVVLIGGCFMMIKMRHWHLIVSFLGVYLGLLLVDAVVSQGYSLSETAAVLQNLLLNSPLLFFSFVMLIEPLTSPHTRGWRVVFGVLIAVALFSLQRFFSHLSFSLELSLLVGNLFARLVGRDFRQAFILKRKELFAPVVGAWWFEPPRRFLFAPGQFLEYTLAHSRPDTRGVRRYFTIASSPTEPGVLVAARLADKGSSFKRALRAMRQGDEIIASRVAGDFVLPSDAKQKLVFVAGGIGVTPFRSMVKYLLDTHQSRDIVLLYAAQREDDLVFRDIFEEAGRTFGMRTIYVLSDVAQVASGWLGKTGMIDASLIQSKVPDFHDRLFYISGPEPMVQGITRLLMTMSIPRGRIRKDYFPGYTA